MISDVSYYEKKSKRLRRYIIDLVFNAESGHFGGSLSCIDLINFIYENYILINGDDFILSKGHAAPALYAKLIESNLIDSSNLSKLRQTDSILTGHPTTRIPTLKFGLGSLGQGASVGLGLAIAYQKSNIDRKVFVLLGDGELNEGQVWEAFYTYKTLNIPNVVFIIDKNNLQLDGKCDEVSGFDSINEKIKAFTGTTPIEMDGHSYEEMIDVFNKLNWNNSNIIIANTIKGYGIDYMEGNVNFHSYSINCKEKDVLYECALKCIENEK